MKVRMTITKSICFGLIPEYLTPRIKLALVPDEDMSVEEYENIKEKIDSKLQLTEWDMVKEFPELKKHIRYNTKNNAWRLSEDGASCIYDIMLANTFVWSVNSGEIKISFDDYEYKLNFIVY